MIENNPQNQIYPNPVEHHAPQAVQQTIQQPAVAADVKSTNFKYWSIAIGILIVLTFFTPLGSALFLPLVVVAIIGVAHGSGGKKGTYSYDAATNQFVPYKRSAWQQVFRVISILLAIAGTLILLFIGLLFLAFSTGGARMGS